MNDRQKQIEEIENLAEDILQEYTNCYSEVDKEVLAEMIYDAGYRKEIEGEWKRSKNCKYDYFCTACGVKSRFNIYRNHDMLTKYCPHCGAKMKGIEV